MESNIGILDYGVGNFASVSRMIQQTGRTPTSVSNAVSVSELDVLLIPGVGHFDFGMKNLVDRGLDAVIRNFAEDPDKKIIGICLGMHLLCRSSAEGERPGLGLVESQVRKFRVGGIGSPPVPHMGWNTVEPMNSTALFKPEEDSARFYFAHSYYVGMENPDIVIGRTSHGIQFCSAFQIGNIYGVQFHPEKSHKYGFSLFNALLSESKGRLVQ